MMAHLSPRISAFADKVGACSNPGGMRTVMLCQSGRIRKDAHSSWMTMTARQSSAIDQCTFDWRGRLNPFGIVQVRDALSAGTGTLSVSAFGWLPLITASPEPALTRGELMRYLGEIPWAPDAIFANPELAFHDENDGSTRVQAHDASITLRYGADNLISEVYAPDRPRTVGQSLIPTPWRGYYSDYRMMAGRMIPAQGNASWIVDGVETTYAEFTITDWRLV